MTASDNVNALIKITAVHPLTQKITQTTLINPGFGFKNPLSAGDITSPLKVFTNNGADDPTNTPSAGSGLTLTAINSKTSDTELLIVNKGEYYGIPQDIKIVNSTTQIPEAGWSVDTFTMRLLDIAKNPSTTYKGYTYAPILQMTNGSGEPLSQTCLCYTSLDFYGPLKLITSDGTAVGNVNELKVIFNKMFAEAKGVLKTELGLTKDIIVPSFDDPTSSNQTVLEYILGKLESDGSFTDEGVVSKMLDQIWKAGYTFENPDITFLDSKEETQLKENLA